jgi:hypothetical protein
MGYKRNGSKRHPEDSAVQCAVRDNDLSFCNRLRPGSIRQHGSRRPTSPKHGPLDPRCRINDIPLKRRSPALQSQDERPRKHICVIWRQVRVVYGVVCVRGLGFEQLNGLGCVGSVTHVVDPGGGTAKRVGDVPRVVGVGGGVSRSRCLTRMGWLVWKRYDDSRTHVGEVF